MSLMTSVSKHPIVRLDPVRPTGLPGELMNGILGFFGGRVCRPLKSPVVRCDGTQGT